MSTHSGGTRQRTAVAGRAAWIAAYDARVRPYIAQYAAQHNMTPDQYQAAVTQRMRDLMVGSRVYTRRSVTTAEHIAREGRFRTLHETGRSGGSTDAEARAALERQLFGQTGTVYAYAGHPGVMRSEHGQYGGAVFELNPSALRGATITFADTLTAAGGREMRPAVVPTALSHPNWRAWDFAGRGDALDYLRAKSDLASWTEVQLPRGLSLDGVARVHFTDNEPPSAQLVADLTARGIPYDVHPWYSPFGLR